MCGLAGHVSFGSGRADVALVARMTDALSHRGPDGDGIFVSRDRKVVLGHRRLAIIDLSEAGHQPMESPDGEVVVILNGEIYNHLELREELEHLGHVFRGDSDTEVLLEGYHEWGNHAVERLRGMFSFGVYDRRRDKFILCRDRIGIKPLYIYRGQEQLAFASELDPLRDAFELNTLDRQALAQYLRYRYISAPNCIWRGAEKFPAGEIWQVDLSSGRIDKRVYWSLRNIAAAVAQGEPRSLNCDELREKLEETLQIHLRSDVPLGVLLSGGLDSTSLLALLGRGGQASSLQSFSVGFGAARSELPVAREVASRFSSDHHEETIASTDLDKALQILARTYGEPLADSSAVPFYFLSEIVARYVKVAIGGDGGDELFYGYRWYTADRLLNSHPVNGFLRICGSIFGSWIHSDTLSLLSQAGSLEGLARFDKLHGCPFDPDEVALLTEAAGCESAPGYDQTLPDHMRGRVYDLQSFTVDSILYKVDAASMAHGLEVRVPFLDHELLEYSLALRSAALYRGFQTKRALRMCVGQYLPRSVLNGRKIGFSLPLKAWRAEIKRLGRKYVPDGAAVQGGLLSPEALAPIFAEGDDVPVGKIWVLLVLENWLRQRPSWR